MLSGYQPDSLDSWSDFSSLDFSLEGCSSVSEVPFLGSSSIGGISSLGGSSSGCSSFCSGSGTGSGVTSVEGSSHRTQVLGQLVRMWI